MMRNERRKRLRSRQDDLASQGLANTKDRAKVLRISAHWTPEQATAVYEVLDELLDIVLRTYSTQIEQTLKLGRSTQQQRDCPHIHPDDEPF